MSRLRNQIGFVLLLISLGLLVPGLTLDVMTLNVSISVPLLGRQEIHDETRSVLGTIVSLHENGNLTVAFLILLFSVVVPLVKAGMTLAVLVSPRMHTSLWMHRFVGVISKWAMADVFVIGVLIAFLSTSTDENIKASLHAGFYCFAAYCIVSIIAVQTIRLQGPEAHIPS